MGRTFAIITGGGTAGHVMPALSVAQALVARGHRPDEITFVGARRGLEARMVPAAGFEVNLLPGRGLVRRMRLSNLLAVGGMSVAFLRALSIVARKRPSVVVSLGGYAGLPSSMAAVVFRTPLVLVNPDAVPGGANQMMARFAEACAVAFDGTSLPRALVTGTPVRRAIVEISRTPVEVDRARHVLGIPSGRKVLAVFGGSLGSSQINQAVQGLVTRWKDREDVAIYHVVGRRDWSASVEDGPAPDSLIHYTPVEYEERMELLYASADLIISRAGANTVAELSAVGVPALLIPLPGAPHDHQSANAAVLARAGAAEVLPDSECTDDRLDREAGRLLADAELLHQMAKAAQGLGRPDASDRVAALVEEHAAKARQ